MISAVDFFEVFLKELKLHPALRAYYKFHESPSRCDFRKAYFLQRLQYIERQITNRDALVCDIGCGYGTTAVFLALNGFRVEGNTLEFYYREIPQRMEFWRKYGDVSRFTASYENLFDMQVASDQFGYIVVQDALHHLEPISDALNLCRKALGKKGVLVAVEENGSNLVQNAKLYLHRGNKRIRPLYDETLKRTILLGNENIRPLSEWDALHRKAGLEIIQESVEYIRLFPPQWCRGKSTEEIRNREQVIAARRPFIRERFFFGLSFCARPVA